MNKYQEALDRLFESYRNNSFVPFPTRSDLDTLQELVSMLVEKTVPIEDSGDMDFGELEYEEIK